MVHSVSVSHVTELAINGEVRCVCVHLVSTFHTEDVRQSLHASDQLGSVLPEHTPKSKHTDSHAHALFAFVYARQQMAAHYWADRVVIWQAPCYPPLLPSPHRRHPVQHSKVRALLGGRVDSTHSVCVCVVLNTVLSALQFTVSICVCVTTLWSKSGSHLTGDSFFEVWRQVVSVDLIWRWIHCLRPPLGKY